MPQRPRVVIVEDFTAMARLLTRLLTPECEVVAVVADGREAVEAATQCSPDVMLIDVNLPTVSGLEACRAITTANPGTKVVLISGLVDPVLKSLATAAGASAFVSKTSAGKDLLPAIRSVLADPQTASGGSL